MKEPLELTKLNVGSIYREILLDDDGSFEPGEDTVLIVTNVPGLIWVYLIGCYTLTEKGKANLLALTNEKSSVEEYQDSIPASDYRELTMNQFLDKHGFHDEGLIAYDKALDSYTVENDYVGRIQFINP